MSLHVPHETLFVGEEFSLTVSLVASHFYAHRRYAHLNCGIELGLYLL
jgi:hypothetical protein